MRNGNRQDLTALSEELVARHFSVGALEARFQESRRRLGRGVDRVTAEIFERTGSVEFSRISERVSLGTYRFSPYLEKLVSKGRARAPRQIAKPTVRDKLCLGALKDVLHELLPDHVPRELPNQVIRKLLIVLAENPGSVVIKADIKSFYDCIPHGPLLDLLEKKIGSGAPLNLVAAALGGSIVPYGHKRAEITKYKIDEGVPQGLPISNFLANLYLVGFDTAHSGKYLGYARYVDDIVLVIDKKSNINAVISTVTVDLKSRGLELGEDKTKAFAFDESFEYLGYQIKSGKASPRRASVEKFLRGVAGLFAALRYKKFQGRPLTEKWGDEAIGWLFVYELNEKITGAISGHRQYGWVFYFNESNDLTVFAEVDAIIRKMARKTDLLRNEMRAKIKSTLTAFNQSKGSKGSGYILNYDLLGGADDKRAFIAGLGYESRDMLDARPDEYVDELYKGIVERRLKNLDRDIGLIS